MKLWGKTAFFYVLIIVATIGCAAATKPMLIPEKPEPLPKLYSTHSNLPPVFGPIIRLSTLGSKQFFCSGFVVDDNYAVTANHCLEGHKRHILVNGVTVAKILGGSEREDFGLLQGDFRRYMKAPFAWSEGVSMVMKGRLIKACGYPEGSAKVVCTIARGEGPAGFMLSATGELQPGMSGGPAYDLTSGVVIGINSHVSNEDAEHPDRIFFARVLGIPGAFDIDPNGR